VLDHPVNKGSYGCHVDSEKRARMAFGDRSIFQRCSRLLRQREQAERVRHTRAASAYASRHLFLGERVVAYQPVERGRLFQRAKVLPLDVLNQGKFHGRLGFSFPLNNRNGLEAGHTGSLPAPFSRNQPVPAMFVRRRYQERLQDPVEANRVGELF
jgi:hypothetical protein